MLTVNYFVENKLSVNHVLTPEDKQQLLIENKNGNYSYLSLLREMLSYRGMTVQDVLKGWSGIQLVKVPSCYKRVKRK